MDKEAKIMPTGLVLTMWIVWASVVVITAALYMYRSSLAKNEDGQVFLDEAFAHEKAMQNEIVTRINKVEPMAHAGMIATAVMSGIVIVYYLYAAYVSLFG